MLNIKDIDRLINILNEVKKEQESKQLDMLQEKIKQEIIKEIERALINFQSESMIKFLDENDLKCCSEFNFKDIIDKLEETIKVDVWEV